MLFCEKGRNFFSDVKNRLGNAMTPNSIGCLFKALANYDIWRINDIDDVSVHKSIFTELIDQVENRCLEFFWIFSKQPSPTLYRVRTLFFRRNVKEALK